MKMVLPFLVGILWFVLQASTGDAQNRFLAYDPPGSYKNRVRLYINDELTVRLKEDKSYYTGTLTSISDATFSINNVEIPLEKVDRIRIKRAKKANILIKLLGFGAQGYVIVRLINSAINGVSPPITIWELAITTPIIIFYYVYDFILNRKTKEYRVTHERPLKAIILEPSFDPY